MFGFLKDKLKKSIDRLTKKIEEKPAEKPEVKEAETLVEKKLEHEDPEPARQRAREETLPLQKEPEPPAALAEAEETIKEIPKIDVSTETPKRKGFISKLLGKKDEVREAPATEEHHHVELLPKEKERVRKRVVSLTKKTLTEEEIDEVLWDLQVALLESDVALETAEKICAKIKGDLGGGVVSRGKVEETIKKSFREAVGEVLKQEPVDLVAEIKKAKKPYKIVFLGFNGSGKTTTIARLAHLLKQQGINSVLAAGDTWRAAAIQQLEKHGDALGVRVVKHDYGSDAAAVIFDAVKYAEANDLDVVLADTAGRAHTNKNLMDELHKIIRVIKPDKKILIIDSLTGNDAVEQARAFATTVGVDGIILTKMDVNEKGGAALSVAHTIGKPIYYIGTGQGYGDLEPYEPQRVLKALLG